MGTDMEVIDVDAERGPPPSFREATAPPPAEAEAEAAAGEGAAGVEDDAEAEAEVEVVEEVVTMEDHGDDEDLAKLKGAGGGSVLLLAASTGAEENVVGDEAWAPWKTDRDFENEKQQKEFEELIERTGGIVDSRHALCCVHGKQRLISLMARMPGPREMYRCSQDSICAGGEARRREAAATAKTGGGGGGDDPTTPAAAGGGTKRYFGGMKEMMFKKRSWRKVCWECGIGEHEKYQCPNRICPTTGQVGKPPARGPGATLVVKWTPSMHLLSTADMSGSECAVCGKQGQVNCCSAQLSTTPSCARCLEKGHTFDECIVNQNTNYGGRPGGAGGQYQQQAPRPRRPPSTVSLPPYQPAPEASQTAVMRPEMVEGMRLASAPSRGYHSGGFGGGGKGGGKGGFGGGGGGGGPGGYGRPPPAHYQQQHHPPARGHQGYPTQPTHHAAGSGHHRAPPPAYYQQAPPQRYDPYPQQWHGERDRHPPRQHHGKSGAYHHGGGKGSGGGKGGGGGKARYPY